MTIGQRGVGRSKVGDRHPADFYPTPASVTRALLREVKFRGEIWECACGDGAMAKILEKVGYPVVATDLHDRGYGRSGVDFLKPPRTYDNIVTNPPFTLAEELIAGARYHRKMALFLRLAFIESYSRYQSIFTKTPLSRVIVFSQRVTLMPPILRANGKMKSVSAVAYAWYVWDKAHKGPPLLSWTGRLE